MDLDFGRELYVSFDQFPGKKKKMAEEFKSSTEKRSHLLVVCGKQIIVESSHYMIPPYHKLDP